MKPKEQVTRMMVHIWNHADIYHRKDFQDKLWVSIGHDLIFDSNAKLGERQKLISMVVGMIKDEA